METETLGTIFDRLVDDALAPLIADTEMDKAEVGLIQVQVIAALEDAYNLGWQDGKADARMEE